MLIAQLTDLHVRPPGKPANRVVETNMFTERAFRALAAFAPRPEVVLLTGDLTERGLDEEYANLARLISRTLPMPVFVIPGNHDRRENLRRGLAHLPGVTTDPAYVQYTVEEYPVRLVMLDTLVPGCGHGELRPEQLEWLDRTLATVPDRPTLIGMHHPPFACGIAHMDRINLRNATEFAGVIARHRQVERIVCGHHHRPIVTRVAHAIASISPSVAHQVEMSLDPVRGDKQDGCRIASPRNAPERVEHCLIRMLPRQHQLVNRHPTGSACASGIGTTPLLSCSTVAPAFPSRPGTAMPRRATAGMRGAQPPAATHSAPLCASMARMASTGPSPP